MRCQDGEEKTKFAKEFKLQSVELVTKKDIRKQLRILELMQRTYVARFKNPGQRNRLASLRLN